MSHHIYDGLVMTANLGTEFDVSANPIVLKLDPTITKLPSGQLKANVISSISGTTLTQNGTPIDLLPAIKAGETLTTMAYDNVGKKITYINESGTPVVVDLSALATDVYITGASLDAATMVLTLTDNSATTPDIVLNLAELKKVATANSPSVTFGGTGEASSPLTATVTSLPAGVVIPAAQLTGIIPPAVATASTTNAIVLSKAIGLRSTVNTVASTQAIAAGVIADILGFDAAGVAVHQTKAALAATLMISPSQIVPGVLPAGVTMPASQVTGQTVSNTIAGVGAARTISTTVNGVVGTPVPLPETVIPPTTVSNAVTDTATGSTLITTVNGVASASVNIPDNQTLTLGGSLSAPALTISNGNTVTFPGSNTFAITKAGGAVSTVNTIAATQAIPVGAVVDVVGFNAAGTPVNQTVASLPIAPSQLTAGALPATVTVSAASLPPTTNTLVYTASGPGAGNLTSTVNGVASTQAIGPVVTKLFANYGGGANTIPGQVQNLGGGSNLTYTNFVTMAAAGTVTLPPIASYPKNEELYVKAFGAWTGVMTIASTALIDGLASYPVNKPSLTLHPSVTLMHNGTTWYVV